ncbi:hypothetical protein [Nocardioides nanhaiensis]|uniref:hypothetical protein n=1 Tax=Nocardioides nanhaiensis TaxID=1476871 RepID=UPI0031EF0FA7
MTDSPTPRPPSSETAAVGAHLAGGFLAALVLVLPLGATLGTTTYGALYLWFLGGVALVAVLGLLLRLAGVPRGLGVALAAAGAFSVAAPIALAVVAGIGAPADDAVVALAAGIPAAAVAAPVAAVVVRFADSARGAAAVGATACAAGLLVASLAGPEAGQAVLEDREDAERVAELEASGLQPLLPRLEGTVTDFASTTYTTPPGGARTLSGYTLRYEPEGAEGPLTLESPYLFLDVQLADGTPVCEPIDGYLTCREGDGYTVIGRDGVDEDVVAEDGAVRLSASLHNAGEGMPDADAVGRAMADAEVVDWEEILDLEG